MILFPFYLIMVAAVEVTGIVCAALAIVACRRGECEKLRKAVALLKLWTIPFYILNFGYSVIAWFVIVLGTRGAGILFLPIPIVVTCMMVVSSGCVGCAYVKCLRKSTDVKAGGKNGMPDGRGYRPSGIHYVLQLITIADVISAIIILNNDRNVR